MSSLLSLRFELRVVIWKYSMPHDTTIKLFISACDSNQLNGSNYLQFIPMDGYGQPCIASQFSYSHTARDDRMMSRLTSSLFEVNQQIRSESIDILYRTNTFEFNISFDPEQVGRADNLFEDDRFPPARQTLPEVFRKYARKIRILIAQDCWEDGRLFKIGKTFISLIAEALTDSANGKSLLPPLEQLHILYIDRQVDDSGNARPPRKLTLYLLEPLVSIAAVRQIKEARVRHMPAFTPGPEFGQKLEGVLTGQIQLQAKVYQDGRCRRSVQGLRSPKCYYDPEYDWGESESHNERDQVMKYDRC